MIAKNNDILKVGKLLPGDGVELRGSSCKIENEKNLKNLL
jgi:hypothetical protein